MKGKMKAAVFALLPTACIAVLLLTACPNAAVGGSASVPVLSGQNLDIQGTVLKGYKGAKPVGKLTVPAHITEIAEQAFAECDGLTSIDLVPCTALTTIGKEAFSRCNKAEIRLPSSVTAIDSDAFLFCKAVFVPDDRVKTLVTLSGFPLYRTFMVLTAEDGFYFSDSAKTNLVYVDGSKAGAVSIPASVTTIGEDAFKNCEGLTSVDLSGCTGLKIIGKIFFPVPNMGVWLPASVTAIDSDAFLFCKAVFVPDDRVKTLVTSSGFPLDRTFMGLTAEDGFYFSDSAKTNLVYVDGSKAGAVSIPASVTTIGKYAFKYCSGLTGVDLSGCTGLQTIGESAFWGCSGLTGVDLSGCTALTTIGKSAFWGCSGLTTVNLRCTALTSIGDHAFAACGELTSVDLRPCTALTTIGESAFPVYGMSVWLPASVTEIGSNAFDECRAVFVPKNEVKTLVTSSGFPLDRTFMGLTAEDGFYFSDSAKTALVYVDGSKAGAVSIPASVTTIGVKAFSNCSGLTGVDLSGCTGLTTIGAEAFSGCYGLTTVNLSGCAALTTIGKSAFWGCSGLTTVNLRCTALTTIGAGAFSNCSGLTGVDLSGCTGLTSIGDRAFAGSKAEIRLPSSVIGIGQHAFGRLNWLCKKVIVPNDQIKNLVTGSPCDYPAERVEVQP